MLDSLSSKVIVAKIRAMYGRRLTVEDYNELLRRRSVGEVASYLKTKENYADALKAINESSIHRGQLEALLRHDLFNKYDRLCRYEGARSKGFSFYIILLAETEQILRCIMLLNAKSMDEFILDLPGYLIKHTSFNLLDLAHVRSYKELLEVIRHTPYEEIVRRFPPDEDGLIDYTSCEVALRTFDFQRIFELIDQYFKGATRSELNEVLHISVELLNLSRIFRMKTYYHYSAEEIKKRILPFYFRLSPSRLDKLLENETVEDMQAYLRLTPYAPKAGDETLVSVENYIDRLKFLFNNKLIHFSTNAPSVLYAFMTLSEIELENIISIIEGIRYEVPADEIKKMLIV